MKEEKIGGETYVTSLTSAEWKLITSAKYRRHAERIAELAKDDQCWLPGAVGQGVYEYINRVWERDSVPYRLRSDPPNMHWRYADKKLRIQTVEEWEKSKVRTRPPRKSASA